MESYNSPFSLIRKDPLSSMKVLVFGSKGWIGGQFVKVLNKAKVLYVEATSRADDYDSVKNEMKEVRPTHVISFIGRTHGQIDGKEYTTIDYLEQEGKLVENLRDNLMAPVVLTYTCSELGIHYTYLGTGCIFKFDEEHPFGKEENGFDEEAKPNFFGSSYSIVKGFTDKLLHMMEEPSTLNLRIRMPITNEENKRNFITKIATYEKVCSIPNSMTVLPEMLPIVLDMMRQGEVGTINLTNPGLISHNEILEMYKEYVDSDFTWENFSAEEQRAILAADRSNNYLNTTKLQQLYPFVKNIKDAVRECLKNFKKEKKDVSKVADDDNDSEIEVEIIVGP